MESFNIGTPTVEYMMFPAVFQNPAAIEIGGEPFFFQIGKTFQRNGKYCLPTVSGALDFCTGSGVPGTVRPVSGSADTFAIVIGHDPAGRDDPSP